MLFFDCTSVFHIFIILYCMRNRYNIEKDKAIILIPEHVESLVEKVPKIKELGFVKDVYLVNADLSYEEIDKKLSDVAIKENDTVHMIGWSRLGLWLNRLGTVKRARRIVIEEGGAVLQSIESHKKTFLSIQGLCDASFGEHTIDEIWKLEGNHISTNCHVVDLKMNSYFSDSNKKNTFLNDLRAIFEVEDIADEPRIVWFDNYAVSAFNLAPEFFEKLFLGNIEKVLSDYDYEVKPHPSIGKRDVWSENTIYSRNDAIPWEIVMLKTNPSYVKNQIFISYGICGSITNAVYLLNQKPHIIFLDKLLENYGINYVANELIHKFKEIVSAEVRDKIYEPSSISELKDVIDRIIYGASDSCDSDIQTEELVEELTAKNDILLNAYKKCYPFYPKEKDYTQLQVEEDGLWKTIDKHIIRLDDGDNEISFSIPVINTNDKKQRKIRWYFAGMSAIDLKILSIHYNDVEADVVDERYKCIDATENADGYFVFDTLDPMIELLVPSNIEKITIRYNVLFKKTINDMVNVCHKEFIRYQDNINTLLNDLSDRDIVNNQLIKDIEARDKIVDQISKDIEARDKAIDQLINDIKTRDNNYQIAVERISIIENSLAEAKETIQYSYKHPIKYHLKYLIQKFGKRSKNCCE